MANDILSNKNKLAIEGGTPVRKELLPYGKHFAEQKDINAVIIVLESDWLTMGPIVGVFERLFTALIAMAYTLDATYFICYFDECN
jgi:perosamine synthetase